MLFSDLNLYEKEFRIENDKIIFTIELSDLNKLNDSEKVKIDNMIPNWEEQNRYFKFLFLETHCRFKEMPKLLELVPEDFKFQTTCKEFNLVIYQIY